MNKDLHLLINNAVDLSHKINNIKNDCYNERKINKGNFNIFSAIVSGKHSRDHYEMYHSNIIAYFLNPNASHDCDDIFLKEFLEILKVEKQIIIPESTIIKNLSCERERYIDSGRCVDISLEFKNDWIIFIENKVSSGESHNQMSDYCTFANDNFTNGIGIFLSSDGYLPQSISNQRYKKSLQLVNLSYSNIIHWLENCLKSEELNNISKIKDAILQYITIIKKTIYTMEDKEINKTVEYLTDKENFNSLIHLYKNKEGLINALENSVNKIRKKFLYALANEFKLNDYFDNFKIVFINKRKDDNCFEIKIQYNEKDIWLILEQSYPDFEGAGQGIWFGIHKNQDRNRAYDLNLEHNFWEGLIYSYNNQEINDYTNTFESTIILLDIYRKDELWNEIVSQCEQKIKQILINNKEIIIKG